ncbi:hypothetical protein ACFFMP_21110 [Pseudoroseomonas cervicalis]|uniref:Bacteriophage-related protein n=1 Tax=Pseudoroseomonas cervicalis ATCC 49957 TaxID=525371 RepID=D5RPP3_9PROT|nr:hypothetical protein [Pseudoroseomonas cervicalis]EFH10739.1 hypothetical protein HMPREF0731_3055 [Pseudoroseomonas cervicalis ATCC 49957]
MTNLTVHVPLAIRRRGGRKRVMAPEGAPGVTVLACRADPALVKALARGFRYRKLLDQGRYASITEMAAAEKIDRGYLGRLLQLTLLAPEIVEAILDGRQPEGMTLVGLMTPSPTIWRKQRDRLAGRTLDATAR